MSDNEEEKMMTFDATGDKVEGEGELDNLDAMAFEEGIGSNDLESDENE
jgi:hypothetical protein